MKTIFVTDAPMAASPPQTSVDRERGNQYATAPNLPPFLNRIPADARDAVLQLFFRAAYADRRDNGGGAGYLSSPATLIHRVRVDGAFFLTPKSPRWHAETWGAFVRLLWEHWREAEIFAWTVAQTAAGNEIIRPRLLSQTAQQEEVER